MPAKTRTSMPRARSKGDSSGDLPRQSPAQAQRARRILAALEARYPDAHCELDHHDPLQLLVATILSAQATDAGVNKATPRLFARFRTAADFAAASPQEIEPYIASIGLFRNKAKAIHSACETIVERYGGQVPRTMEELLTLRGVARKTANVVLGNAFGINEGVVVDTHVARVAARFGLTKHTDPARIERDLMSLFPCEKWALLAHLLIFHGRRVCKARQALCAEDSICRVFCSNAAAERGKTARQPAHRPRKTRGTARSQGAARRRGAAHAAARS